MACQASQGESRKHPLAHQRGIHAGTNSDHPPHGLPAEWQLSIGPQPKGLVVTVQKPQSIQDIAKVQARGLHRQLQLSWLKAR